MTEKISHTALTTHSATFQLLGNVYTASLFGTIANGADALELKRLVNGQPMSIDPPIRYLAGSSGGSQTFSGPAGTYQWRINGSGHNVSTNIVAGSG